MNCLVAGGAGFIGSHLCDALLANGHKVICVDKYIMGDMQIKHLFKNPMFVNYRADLTDPMFTGWIFRQSKPDIIFHLAANSDIQKGGLNPEIDYKDTLLTTKTILDSMRKNNVKKLFFASTSAVYGDKSGEELSETTGELLPVSYYGGAKLASEALISSYAAMNDMEVVIFRFPNVIGPRLTHGVIYDFYKKLSSNPNILRILGDGTQCKQYIYSEDLIRAIIERTGDIKPGVETYNISVKGEGTTVTRIAEILVEEMGLSDVKFEYTGGNRGWKGDVPAFSYDISKILATGWEPKYSSEEAVRHTIKNIVKEIEKDD